MKNMFCCEFLYKYVRNQFLQSLIFFKFGIEKKSKKNLFDIQILSVNRCVIEKMEQQTLKLKNLYLKTMTNV